jgi:hypothetical protein
MQYPRLFINVFRFDGKDMPLESYGVAKTLVEAATDAEDYADEYQYTLSDTGRLDLTPLFSSKYHRRRAQEAVVDSRIDQLKDLETFKLTERA